MALSTVPDKTVGDIFSEAMWDDYIKTNINELIGRATRNQLVNGGFEVWQRGASGFTGGGQFTSDRWQMGVNSGTLTITQETSIVDASAAALKAVTTGTVNSLVIQRVEGYQQLQGKTISLSVRVRQSVASAVSLRIEDGTGQTNSATSATTGSFVTLTVTRAMSASATFCDISVYFAAAGTFYLDNAMLVIGPNATEYVPLHPQEDLARCQRYYEIHGGVATAYPDLQMRAGAAEALHHSYSFNVTKGGTPTVTKNGTWAVSNCGQPSVVGLTVNGYTLSATATGAGLMAFNPNSADDQIVAEFNP